MKKLLYKSFRCPMQKVWTDTDSEFESWLNWSFTKENIYSPLIMAADEVYLYPMIGIRHEDTEWFGVDNQGDLYDDNFKTRLDKQDYENETVSAYLDFIDKNFEEDTFFLKAKSSFKKEIDSPEFKNFLADSPKNRFISHLCLTFSSENLETVKATLCKSSHTANEFVSRDKYLVTSRKHLTKLGKKIIKEDKIMLIVFFGQNIWLFHGEGHNSFVEGVMNEVNSASDDSKEALVNLFGEGLA